MVPKERSAAKLALVLLGFQPKIRSTRVFVEDLEPMELGRLLRVLESQLPNKLSVTRYTLGRGLHVEIL